ncbi:MAG: nucleoside 2-deoxyribosyltransferase [bacterium]|nr:nucleoside 2-deoxyribosyltransferase [bacterium]MXZ30292.1 nucleoside 2-deoxyribosyltransferase [Acidimicrobiia bacterium]MDE0667849.1 nucleoside 2-deoxyribosyltransferase [bacterium]MYB24598.1 nucleoside 2-deoxyribosyltransferase [Acidimicrobiia bacterium]MYE66996.1 nucleoside 2-deoxyribosyltransferase [Acidimicrobiia bacterium]
MSGRKTLYLANPYGFSPAHRAGPLNELIDALTSAGADPWEPFALGDQEGWTDQPGWAYKVGQNDMRLVRESDGIFAVVNGCPPDEGVMVELGMAIAWGKPTFLYRDDFRRCADSETYPLNLMLYTGLPEHGWQDFWYTKPEEIADPTKALARWLAGEAL